MNLKIIAIILATALLFIPGVLAWGCSVVTDCPQGFLPLFYLSGSTNAHAANQSGSGYSYVVCCDKKVEDVDVSSPFSCTNLKNQCDVVLRLSNGTNAHVEQNSYSNYNRPIYISIASKNYSGAVNCSYFDECPEGFYPIVSISNRTNAHVANATGDDSYPIKVCCKLNPDLAVPSTEIEGVAEGNTYGPPISIKLQCNDTESGCDKIKYCLGAGCTPNIIKSVEPSNPQISIVLDTANCTSCTLRYNSIDKVGNEESINTINFKISTDMPSCSINTTATPEYTNANEFTVNGYASNIKAGQTIQKYELNWTKVNATGHTSTSIETITTSTGTFSYSFSGCKDKEKYTVKCKVYVQNNSNTLESSWSGSHTILVDQKAPDATIIKPEEETVRLTAGKFLVEWTGDDGTNSSGISTYSVEKSSDGESWETWLESTDKTKENFSASAGQTWYLRVRAMDRAGNIGNWSDAKKVFVAGELQINWSFLPTTGIIKIGENITIKAAIFSEINISSVEGVYSGNATNITINITNISKNRWNVTWQLIEPQKGINQTFKLVLTDVFNKSTESGTNFSVVDCIPSENRTCCNGVNGTICQGSTYPNTVCTFGIQVCNSSYMWGGCNGIGPSTEICDSKDNDCDGEIDEGINCQCTPNTTRLICPWGYCNTTGLAEGTYNFESWCQAQEQKCNASGVWGSPTGGRGPKQEMCNGIDDDCDGETDENSQCCTPENSERKYGLQNQNLDGIGICKIGIDKCQNGQWVTIQTPQAPTSEICDNQLDDDCDGKTDVQDEDCQGWGFEFPWWILVGAGIGVLVALIVLWVWFRKKGVDLTWDNLMKKWAPAE